MAGGDTDIDKLAASVGHILAQHLNTGLQEFRRALDTAVDGLREELREHQRRITSLERITARHDEKLRNDARLFDRIERLQPNPAKCDEHDRKLTAITDSVETLGGRMEEVEKAIAVLVGSRSSFRAWMQAYGPWILAALPIIYLIVSHVFPTGLIPPVKPG